MNPPTTRGTGRSIRLLTDPPAPPASTLKLQPYAVSVPWVRVTVAINAASDAKLRARTEYIQANLGHDLYSKAIQYTHATRAGRRDPLLDDLIGRGMLKVSPGPKSKPKEWVLHLEARWMKMLEDLAAFHNVDPADLFRGLILGRLEQLREFDNYQARRQG